MHTIINLNRFGRTILGGLLIPLSAVTLAQTPMHVGLDPYVVRQAFFSPGEGALSETYRGYHMQFVYTPNEIKRGVLNFSGSKSIVEFGLYLESCIGGGSYEGFTITMWPTTATEAGQYDPGPIGGVEPVFGPKSYIPKGGGIDTLTLDKPFEWNGTDYIMVDICFYNDLGKDVGDCEWRSQYRSVTALLGYTADENICSMPTSSSSARNRPGAYFGFCCFDEDAAALELTVPSPGFNPDSTYDLTLRLGNNAESSLQTIEVHCAVNQDTLPSFTWTGDLPSFETSAPFVFASHQFQKDTVSTVKVWLSDPNGKLDSFAMNDTISATTHPGLGGIYSVGGPGGYFPNLTTCVNLLNKGGVYAPAVFNINDKNLEDSLPSVYAEQITIHKINGASAKNTVTFQTADGSDTSVIIRKLGEPIAWHLDGASHVVMRNLKIQATGVYMPIGPTFTLDVGLALALNNGAHDNLFEGNTFLGSPDAFSRDVQSCVYSGEAIDSNNTFIANKFVGGSYGAYFAGDNSFGATSMEKGIVFDDNHFIGQNKGGIYGLRLETPIARNNVLNTITESGYTGIRFNYYGKVYNRGGEISGNWLDIKSSSTNFSYGISLRGLASSPSEKFKVYNNFVTISGRGRGGALRVSQTDADSAQVEIIYNTLICELEDADFVSTLDIGASDITIYNNNLVGKTVEAVLLKGSGDRVASDHNNIFLSGTGLLGSWEGNEASSLSEWQAISGMDGNSVSVDPEFVRPADPHLANPFLDGAGIAYGGITVDIDGQARNENSPDIGADEFTIGFDGTVVFILNPEDGSAVDTPASVPVIVKLSNAGSEALMNFQVSYTVNGGTPVVESYGGILDVGRDTIYTFLTPWIPDSEGTYTICAKIILPSDVNSGNDEKCNTVEALSGWETGIESHGIFYSLKVYPNPFADKITLFVSPPLVPGIRLDLFDTQGRCIPVNWDRKSSAEVKISAEALKEGIYFLRIMGAYGSSNWLKIQKNK